MVYKYTVKKQIKMIMAGIKISCDNVIYNINTDDYNESILAYQD